MTMLANGEFVPANELRKAYFINDDGENEGLKLLKRDDYFFVACKDCGDVFAFNTSTKGVSLRQEGLDMEDIFICPNCRDDYFICFDCGCWSPKDDSYYIEDLDDSVCSNCFHDGEYFICDDCNNFFSNNECHTISHINGNTTHVCDKCFSGEYVTCYRCGKNYQLAETVCTEDTNNNFCFDCADDELFRCDDCGNYFEYRSNVHEEGDGYYYCNDCRPYVINEYSFKPTPIFKCMPIEQDTIKEFFGFEIEVDGDTEYAEDFLEEFGDTKKQEIYLKRDSSVEGFEIVTHPMTRTYINTVFRSHLAKGMDYLISEGFRGHNKGGIHIHVSREAITNKQLLKMHQLLFYKLDKPYSRKKYNKWLAITQRKDNEMNSWSKMEDFTLQDYMYCEEISSKYLSGLKTVKKKLEEGKTQLNSHSNRYKAINLENEHTIEFRIFNSNLRVDRIMKNAQVIFSLIDFTATNELPTMRNYLNFVMRHSSEYKEFADFLLEKNIIPNPEIVAKQQKLIKQVKLAVEDETYINTMRDVQNYINSLLVDITDVDRNENERITERCA